MRAWRPFLLACAGALAWAPNAGAQTPPPRPAPPARPAPRPAPRPARPRREIRITLNAGAELLTPRVEERITITENVESTPISASIPLGIAPTVDGGATLRLSPRVGLGASFSFGVRQSDAEVTAAIPHPFYFNARRDVSGTAPGLDGRELAIHGEVRVYLRELRFADVAIVGGPSVFLVRQDLVNRVTYTEAYPYDTATFSGVTTESTSGTQVGFNVGADIVRRLRRRNVARKVGVGVLVRYTGAWVDVPVVGNTTTIRTGGLQALAGFRFWL